MVRDSDLARGSLYPPMKDIRRISLSLAVSIARKAYSMKLARGKRPRDLRKSIAALMYEP